MSDPKNGRQEGGNGADEPVPEPANDRSVTQTEGQEPSLEAEIAQLREELLRALAEAENIRKRAERDRYDISQYSIKEFGYALLSVADNLRRAIDSVPAEARDKTSENVKNLLAGVEVTERELLSVFEKFKIKRLDPKGQKFNPNFHQAIAEIPGTGKPAGTVIDVAQSGYTIAERLLRPAMVTVAKAESASDRDEPGSSVDTTA
jgi:molecular chaperone GrpE